jgi:two-component system nitrogen regulation response regulator GlnG
MVANSPVMQEVFRRIAYAAASDANVLITGESGTGKELVARAIHRYSARASGPFVAVNVAALSPSLAESELFGHVRGAFTGADQTRVGLLAQADGGTLFLDEVADIPLPAQVKLLRAIEEGEVVPVGSNDRTKTDFRVVSATHQELLNRVQDGSFRHDLYFRLCAFQIDIPPLRNRAEDIRDLADHFLRLSTSNERPPPPVAAQTYTELASRPWYGNVRELRNAVEHALILARGSTVMPEHLPPPASIIPEQMAPADQQATVQALVSQWAAAQFSQADNVQELYNQLLAIVEPPLFAEALKQSRGQCAEAARKLGMHRTTLRKKLDQYNIE